MLIVDSRIHIRENETMSAHHRQVRTYSMEDALREMAGAGVDAALLHPPSSLPKTNATATDAARQGNSIAAHQLIAPRPAATYGNTKHPRPKRQEFPIS